MTESEWLAATVPETILAALKGEVRERKLRLFALSCCRRVDFLLGADDMKRCRFAIGTLENQIEKIASDRELQTALVDMVGEAMDAGNSVHHPGDLVWYAISAAAYSLVSLRKGDWANLAKQTCEAIAYDSLVRSNNTELEGVAARWNLKKPFNEVEWRRDETAIRELHEYVAAYGIEQTNQAHRIRDIFGNPFRPVAFDLSWGSDTVLSLARHIYNSRDSSAMPVLADALQDAGCDNDDILNHCRDANGVHVRGCWVVDLLLGKS